MKKHLASLIAIVLVFMTCTCYAASYTLPEKMYNQLAIGSGLKGSFAITAEGEAFQTPFMNLITDADFYIRGISSGKDLHYYVFQKKDEEQSAVSELYRKDGIYYFRSDMVQGKVLSFPTEVSLLDSVLPSGENISSSSFVYKILTLSETERKEKWDPVLTRYQNELEMWLAEFAVEAETVKMDNGLSAVGFTYEIPMEKVNDRIVSLFGKFAADPEVNSLLDTVMTKEEKELYVNGNLLYFYQEALSSFDLSRPVRMSKQVSAMGELLRFRLELPLDDKATGCSMLEIEKSGQLTVYTLNKNNEKIVLTLPETEVFKQPAYEQSVWFARINTESEEEKHKDNLAVRIDIKKTNETHTGEDDTSHETVHYTLGIRNDTTYLPADADPSLLPEFTAIDAEIDLHYFSAYAQNAATTLEISASLKKGTSSASFSGTMKTAKPWLFKPFEIVDPIDTGTAAEDVLIPYLTDWVSNAASMIRHTAVESENEAGNTDQTQTEDDRNQDGKGQPDDENQDTDAETAPLVEPGQE